MAEKFVHNNGNGSLFKNDNKTPDNNQPEYSGSITLPDGTQQQIAAWVKEYGKGKFLSLKLSDPYEKAEEKKEAVAEVKEEKNDVDLPF
jgi:hypothetical protein